MTWSGKVPTMLDQSASARSNGELSERLMTRDTWSRICSYDVDFRSRLAGSVGPASIDALAASPLSISALSDSKPIVRGSHGVTRKDTSAIGHDLIQVRSDSGSVSSTRSTRWLTAPVEAPRRLFLASLATSLTYATLLSSSAVNQRPSTLSTVLRSSVPEPSTALLTASF